MKISSQKFYYKYQNFDLELNNLKKYKIPDLHDFISKYDKVYQNIKKKLYDSTQ